MVLVALFTPHLCSVTPGGALLSQGSGESHCDTKRQARGLLSWSSVARSVLAQLLFGQKTKTNKHNNKTNQGESGYFGVSGTTEYEAPSKTLFPKQSARPFQRPFPAPLAKAQIKGLTNDRGGGGCIPAPQEV